MACGPIREVAEEILDRRTPRERYEASLVASGMGEYALVRDWNSAAERALREAPLVPAKHIEEVYLSPAEPAALAYRVSARRGQRVTFDVRLLGDSSTVLFIDAWQVEGDTVRAYRRVAVADSGELELELRPRRDGEYVFRAQPEIARGGRLSVTLNVLPTLAFPVHGAHERDIGSVFGDPRDGGQRRHHGIDIFAPRGTPAVAAVAGTVYRVQTTPVGGNVIWLRDEEGNRLYYAHLDRHRVARGEQVSAGDTIGFVGNTGNARTTPPHLHFGVYSRGPVDPFWYVHSPRVSVPRLSADTSVLGRWARVRAAGSVVRSSPDARSAQVASLAAYAALRVVAASGAWYRVRLPDGATGYLSASSAEPASNAMSSAELQSDVLVLARPDTRHTASDVIAEADAGQMVEVMALFAGFLFIRSGEHTGWVSQSALEAQQY